MYPHGSITGRLLTAAVTLLVAAVVVVFAAHLIVSVWVPLAIFGAVLLGIGIAVRVVRTRRSGW